MAMNVRLIEPTARNWILVAENLRDPKDWSCSSPCHTADSDRCAFEKAVRQAALPSCKFSLCEDLLAPGICAIEYSWNVNSAVALDHALKVGDLLQTELLMGLDSALEANNRTAA